MFRTIHLRYGTRVASLPARWHAAISQWFALALLCAVPGLPLLPARTPDGKPARAPALFVRDEWEGIDIYHPPHFKQKNPKKNDGPVSHGFFVFHLTADELTVAERKADDTWGMISRKKLPTATAGWGEGVEMVARPENFQGQNQLKQSYCHD